MSSPMTRDAYLSAFDTWFRVARENGYQPVIEAEEAFRAAVAEGGLPDEGAPDAFCAVLQPRLRPFGPRNVAYMAIYKSDLLARLIYGGEPVRTERCPTHKGKWSGVEMPADWEGTNHCRHGCGLTGWLPVATVPA